MDSSEESIIIIKGNKLNYINKAFLSKYRDIIMQYEAPLDDGENYLYSDEIYLEDEHVQP